MKRSRSEEVSKRFGDDVKFHEMEVKRDDGLYRHLRFRRPETWAYGFDIVTWPGFLAITGDVGEYLFSRVEDMTEFFRGAGQISYGYWAEKCKACPRGKVKEYSEDRFKENVWRSVISWFDLEPGKLIPKPIRDAVKRDVIEFSCEGEHSAMSAAMSFQWEGKYPFQDFWESDNKEYTHQFLWCCHAIQWAILKYDVAHVVAVADALKTLSSDGAAT